MIELNNLHVKKLIIHTIKEKQHNTRYATVIPTTEISTVSDEVLEIIRQRLNDAAGRNSRAFNLEIEERDKDSVFGLSLDWNNENDDFFLEKSIQIAERLAQSQKRTNIPGGYLIIMDCIDEVSQYPVVVIIKAEPHEALQLIDNIEKTNQINVLTKVFLSPSQKLYKIGIIYKKDEESDYESFLFDDQFRNESGPAEYFYKDFLGFSVSGNSKIQSQKFYNDTIGFIVKYAKDSDMKGRLISALKNEFLQRQTDLINPMEFGANFIPEDDGLRDTYIREICKDFSSAFVKDDTLIRRKLKNRKISFGDKIFILGPEEIFDERVKIVSEGEDIIENGGEYTTIQIKGKPYKEA